MKGVALAGERTREGEESDRGEDVEASERRAVTDDHEGHEQETGAEEHGRPWPSVGR